MKICMFPMYSSSSVGHSVVSNSLRPHGLWPARLLCPCNSPGQNTAVGSHSLLQGIFPTRCLTLQAGSLLSEPPGRPIYRYTCVKNYCCCCPASQSCLTLCDPVDRSMPGLLVLHHLPELIQSHVHQVSDAIQPSHPLLPPSSALNLPLH